MRVVLIKAQSLKKMQSPGAIITEIMVSRDLCLGRTTSTYGQCFQQMVEFYKCLKNPPGAERVWVGWGGVGGLYYFMGEVG